MAATIGAAPDVNTIRWLLESSTLDKANKVTQVDGAMVDADIESLLDCFDDCSNARAISCKVGERVVTGLKATAGSTSQNLISAYMVLSFQKTNPVNALKVVTKNFIVPAYKEVLRGPDNNPDPDTAGTGSTRARLGLMIQLLEDNLNYVGADGDNYPGGWTYAGGGFGTGNDVIDGQ